MSDSQTARNGLLRTSAPILPPYWSIWRRVHTITELILPISSDVTVNLFIGAQQYRCRTVIVRRATGPPRSAQHATFLIVSPLGALRPVRPLTRRGEDHEAAWDCDGRPAECVGSGARRL